MTSSSKLVSRITDFRIAPRSVDLFLWVLAIIAAAGFAIMLLLRLKLVVSINSDIGGVEQNVVYGLQQMLNGRHLYSDPLQLPYYIDQYTPVYHFLCYITALALNYGPENIHQLYLIGRIYTLIFNILSIGAIFATAIRFFNFPKTLAYTLAFCSFVFIYRQGFCIRADSMMDTCVLWSIYFFCTYLDNTGGAHKNLWIALSLAIASIFIKQSGIHIPVIFLAFLLINCPFRLFLAAATYSLFLFVILFSCIYLYYGDAFLQNVIGGIDNGISYTWVRNFLWGNGLKVKVVLPALICSYIAFARSLITKGSLMERFLCYVIMGNFVFTTAISFKAGSNIQYFFVFTSLSFLLILYYFVTKYYTLPGGIRGAVHYMTSLSATGFIIAVMVANLKHQIDFVKKVEFQSEHIIAAREASAAKAATFIKERIRAGHYVFANLSNEKEVLTYYIRRGVNNVLFKTAAMPCLDVLDVSITRSEVFGYDNFRNDLISGKIEYIIEGIPVNHPKIPGVTRIRQRYFRPVKKIAGYTIYQHI